MTRSIFIAGSTILAIYSMVQPCPAPVVVAIVGGIAAGAARAIVDNAINQKRTISFGDGGRFNGKQVDQPGQELLLTFYPNNTCTGENVPAEIIESVRLWQNANIPPSIQQAYGSVQVTGPNSILLEGYPEEQRQQVFDLQASGVLA